MSIKKISLLILLGAPILVSQAIAMDSAGDRKDGKEDSSHYPTHRSSGAGVTTKENGQEGGELTRSVLKTLSFDILEAASEGLSDELLLFMINYKKNKLTRLVFDRQRNKASGEEEALLSFILEEMAEMAKKWLGLAELTRKDRATLTDEGKRVVDDLVAYLCTVSLNVPKKYGIKDRVSMFEAMDFAHSIGELDGFVENILVPWCLGEKPDCFADLDLAGPPPHSFLSLTTLETLKSFGIGHSPTYPLTRAAFEIFSEKDYSLTQALFEILNLYKLDRLPIELAKTTEQSRNTAQNFSAHPSEASTLSPEKVRTTKGRMEQRFWEERRVRTEENQLRTVKVESWQETELRMRETQLRAAKDEASAVKLLISWGKINERVLLFLLNFKKNKQMKVTADRVADGTSSVECTEEEERFLKNLLIYLFNVSLSVTKDPGTKDRISMFDVMDFAHSVGELEKFIELVLVPSCLGQKVGDDSIQLSGQDSRSLLLGGTLEKLIFFKNDHWAQNVLHNTFDLYKSGKLPPVLAKAIERYKDSPASVAPEAGAGTTQAASKTEKKDSSTIDYGSYEPMPTVDDKEKSDGASGSEGLASGAPGPGAGYTLPEFDLDF